ncbi:MAG: amidohydrolase [Alphaproteobacteria bacterium]|nr:amidohydrolase [Alphaproteobacteria bacterium]
MKYAKGIENIFNDMTTWRHRLHRFAETAFQEKETSFFIREKLSDFGFDEIHTMAKTGVVGVLHGKKGAGGRSIMLRADMDALPVQEQTGLPYTPGVHHACGHDGHMAMLLGAAKRLADERDFDGTVYFVFQPAEEDIGGAQEMVKEGLFQKFPCESVYGLHNVPNLPLGMFATGPGPMLASSDDFHVTLKGKGGHTVQAGRATDLHGALAEVITNIKRVVREEGRSDDEALVNICAVFTDSTATNVTPNKITFNGSIRSFDPDLQERLKKRLRDIVESAANNAGAEVFLDFKNGYPAVVNTKAETDFAVDVARDIADEGFVVTPVPPILGVEDFAVYLQEKPGNFMAMGSGTETGGGPHDLHTACYDFNDAALPVGASYWVKLVQKALPLGTLPDIAPPVSPLRPDAP